MNLEGLVFLKSKEALDWRAHQCEHIDNESAIVQRDYRYCVHFSLSFLDIAYAIDLPTILPAVKKNENGLLEVKIILILILALLNSHCS